MAEKKLIRQQGFGPHIMPDGRVGFRFQLELLGEGGTRIANFFPLKVALDGVEIPEESVYLSVDGRYFSIAETDEAEKVYWRYREPADIFVMTGKPLKEGLHTVCVSFTQFMNSFTIERRLTSLGTDNPKSKIKRGVSFYSYREAVANREMTLEDCIAEGLKFGATGVEMVTVESVPNYPYPDNAFYRKWFALRERYGFTPVSLDSNNISAKDHFASPPEDETYEILYNDLHMAKYLGFKMIRIGVGTPISVIQKLLPTAEKYNISMAVEIHPPYSMASPWMEERVNCFEKLDSPYVGFIPDMGIFAKRTAPLKIEKMIRSGANANILYEIDALYQAGKSKAEVEEIVRHLEGGEREFRAVNLIYHNNYDDPELLAKYIKYVKNIHGKFYEMDSNMNETSIDYENAIRALQRAGYEGFICSEYEGQSCYANFDEIEEVEQVRRQHLMLQRLLNKT